MNVDKHWNFFNPKAGINFQKDGHNAFVSFSVANREPNRDNFTEAGRDERPPHETLYDYEAGYGFGNSRFHVGANLYFMDYSNQLILTGKISEIGEALTSNIKDSYRMGHRTHGRRGNRPLAGLERNLTLIRNKIKNFTESTRFTMPTGTSYARTNDLGTTEHRLFARHHRQQHVQFQLETIQRKFQLPVCRPPVYRQHLCKDRSIDPYFVSNLRVGYVFKPKFMKEIALDVTINNLFNEQVRDQRMGILGIWSTATRYKEDGYFTQAGTNAMATGNIQILT